ncbi:GFA family protein [Enterococcus viikkiensis]|uniref:GFA family protein n=1 Tax=Enterococcus viikkiensis TaxID=930854 RepID=UPI0010F80E13|nr:GFA family protein [Enterococcus viikkiensis]
MTTAKCLCGKVSIEVEAFHSEVGACHCSMCRRWGSGPLLTVAAGSGENVTINGEDFVSRYRSSEWAERGFCSSCGSNLFYHLIANDSYNIPIDLFEDQGEATLEVEVYYDQKPAYYEFANETKKLTEADIMKMVQQQFLDESK